MGKKEKNLVKQLWTVKDSNNADEFSARTGARPLQLLILHAIYAMQN